MRSIFLASTTACMCAAAVMAQTPGDTTCPSGVPAGTECAGGRDANGSFYFFERPARWNRVLLIYDHGGPLYYRPPGMDQVLQLAAASVATSPVADGYAVAIPSYRDGYWHIDDYVEDNERTRTAFISRFGRPARTYLEGMSFGAVVANRTVERHGPSYDGLILTGGVNAGSMLDAYIMFDSRVIYQYLCHNLPRPDEPQYPLWRGVRIRDESTPFPPELYQRTLDGRTRGDLGAQMLELMYSGFHARIQACAGIGVPDSSRTPDQRRTLGALAAINHAPPSDLPTRISGSAVLLYAIRQQTRGRNVFENRGARYSGSGDDLALNRDVARYAADSQAADEFYELTTPKGTSSIPVISSHSIHDPREPVQLESFYRHLYERANNTAHLLQVFTDRPNHPGNSPTEILALLHAMDAWTTTRTRPTAGAIAELCKAIKQRNEACTFVPGYVPGPLSSIIAAQGRERFLPPGW